MRSAPKLRLVDKDYMKSINAPRTPWELELALKDPRSVIRRELELARQEAATSLRIEYKMVRMIERKRQLEKRSELIEREEAYYEAEKSQQLAPAPREVKEPQPVYTSEPIFAGLREKLFAGLNRMLALFGMKWGQYMMMASHILGATAKQTVTEKPVMSSALMSLYKLYPTPGKIRQPKEEAERVATYAQTIPAVRIPNPASSPLSAQSLFARRKGKRPEEEQPINRNSPTCAA